MVGAHLHGDHPPGVAHRPEQRQGESSRPGARLHHSLPGGDVGPVDDRPDVLGVHDLGAAPHLEDVVGEPGAQRGDLGPARGPHHGTRGDPHQSVVPHEAPGVLKRVTGADLDEVAPPPRVEQQAQVPCLEGLVHPRSAWMKGMINDSKSMIETKMTRIRVARSRLRNMEESYQLSAASFQPAASCWSGVDEPD